MSKIAQKLRERYEKNTKKNAISMMESLIARIKRGEVVVESSGFWAGLPGSWTLKIQVKVLEDSEES